MSVTSRGERHLARRGWVKLLGAQTRPNVFLRVKLRKPDASAFCVIWLPRSGRVWTARRISSSPSLASCPAPCPGCILGARESKQPLSSRRRHRVRMHRTSRTLPGPSLEVTANGAQEDRGEAGHPQRLAFRGLATPHHQSDRLQATQPSQDGSSKTLTRAGRRATRSSTVAVVVWR